MYWKIQAVKRMQEVLKMNKNDECIKLKNKYYDTDSVLKYANIHGGFTIKRTYKMHMAEKHFLNRLYGRGVKNERIK